MARMGQPNGGIEQRSRDSGAGREGGVGGGNGARWARKGGGWVLGLSPLRLLSATLSYIHCGLKINLSPCLKSSAVCVSFASSLKNRVTSSSEGSVRNEPPCFTLWGEGGGLVRG